MASNEVERITISFSDGTEKVIQKGFICSKTDKKLSDDEEIYSFLFANISAKELGDIFESVILCAYELGLIKDVAENPRS